jgi:hypothetical protein
MVDFAKLCGYAPRPEATANDRAAMRYGSLSRDLPWLMSQSTDRDVFLWEALLAVYPEWKRGRQAIGDCVSWGHELVLTMILAMAAARGEVEWIAPVSTIGVYGLRVDPGNMKGQGVDGWYGSDAAKALQGWGATLAIDYSAVTGNPDHDLRVYSEQLVRNYATYGVGGKNDQGKLDVIAKQHPCKGVVPVNTTDELWAAIDAGCPVSICSDVGFGDMERNAEGIVRRSGSWAHCMMIGAKKVTSGGNRLGRIFQSWGKSCSGPDPGINSQAISDCSWWATEDDLNSILRQGDSYAFTSVEGFAQPPYDFANDWMV